MKCSACLTPGHNKATCIATLEEIEQKKMVVVEVKKAQSEAAKAEVVLKKKATLGSQKKKKQVKKGSSKEHNVKVQQRPAPIGIGVFTSQTDGQTYYSTTTRTVRISVSQPATTNLRNSGARTQSTSQPSSSSKGFKFRGKMVYNKPSN
ncbi:hypothetical protein POM88_038275 [Heracleum sosnowskyi]|uniref:Uncharacterized protein n=1 Tax=Heracleum sosnowskyi TaxID=360622 RepID=A0AAD8MHJ2_9APIA|nr:hypothetical protein POM88_038275 [Heracleum sosnowskyi]